MFLLILQTHSHPTTMMTTARLATKTLRVIVVKWKLHCANPIIYSNKPMTSCSNWTLSFKKRNRNPTIIKVGHNPYLPWYNDWKKTRKKKFTYWTWSWSICWHLIKTKFQQWYQSCVRGPRQSFKAWHCLLASRLQNANEIGLAAQGRA